MRMRRRLSENVSVLLVPAVCCAITLYFGYNGIVGPRGLLAWSATQSELERTLAWVQITIGSKFRRAFS